MPTTTFADVKLTEDVQHRYEGENHEFSKGDTVRMPRHTAGRFVNKWDKAEWTETASYEVDEREYEDVVMTVKNSGNDQEAEKDVCEVETDDGEVCGREKPCQYHSSE